MRIFFSYSSRNYSDAAPLVEALRRDNEVFFAPDSIPLGRYWQPMLADEVAKSQAFVLFVAGDAPGDWQLPEYYAASDRKAKDPQYPIIPVILGGDTTRFPFLALINWLVVEPPIGEAAAARINAALRTGVDRSSAPWRHVNPFRDLEALKETDADLFFGRDNLIEASIQNLAEQPRKALVLVGNSGVGKSSLALAGIVPRLRSGMSRDSGVWPSALKESPSWLYLVMKPTEDPVRALTAAFLDEWALDPTDSNVAKKRRDWTKGMQDGQLSISDLVEASKMRWCQLGQGQPAGVFLYLDQGEELYRAKPVSAQRFSLVVSEALDAGDIRMLVSLRSDHYGFLQADQTLFPHLQTLDVPPMSQPQLSNVMRSTAKALGARFARNDLPDRIAEAAAAQPGAMPVLSVYLTELWQEMQSAGDGVLRLTDSGHGIDIAAALEARANGYFKEQPERQKAIRCLFVPNLVRTPKGGPALRRRAFLEDLDPPLRQVAQDLAGPSYRLLITAEVEGRPVIEVAHEALFTAWKHLKRWIVEKREFLEWKDGIEQDRKNHDLAPKGSNLLMGSRLAIARKQLSENKDLIDEPEQRFIRLSTRRARQRIVVLWIAISVPSALLLASIPVALGMHQSIIASVMRVVEHGEEQYRAVLKEREHALRVAQINAAHLFADKAEQLLANGEAMKAVLVALEGLPRAASQNDELKNTEEEQGFVTKFINRRIAEVLQYEEPLVLETLEILAKAYGSVVFPGGKILPLEDAVSTSIASTQKRVITMPRHGAALRWVTDGTWPEFIATVRARVPACLTSEERAEIGLPPRDDIAYNPDYCRGG